MHREECFVLDLVRIHCSLISCLVTLVVCFERMVIGRPYMSANQELCECMTSNYTTLDSGARCTW